jgi:hypothetical protein
LVGTAGRERGGADEVAGETHRPWFRGLRGDKMAAMKPRTGDGPLEVTKEGRGIVMRVPLEGGGRLVVELNAEEAGALGDALKNVVG